MVAYIRNGVGEFFGVVYAAHACRRRRSAAASKGVDNSASAHVAGSGTAVTRKLMVCALLMLLLGPFTVHAMRGWTETLFDRAIEIGGTR